MKPYIFACSWAEKDLAAFQYEAERFYQAIYQITESVKNGIKNSYQTLHNLDSEFHKGTIR